MPRPADRGPGSNQHADKPPQTTTAAPVNDTTSSAATAAAAAPAFTPDPAVTPTMTAERLQDLQDIADLGDPDMDRREFERTIGELTVEVQRLRDGLAKAANDLDGAWWSEADDVADQLRNLAGHT